MNKSHLTLLFLHICSSALFFPISYNLTSFIMQF